MSIVGTTTQRPRFTPQDIPGLTLWLDGKDSNTFFQDVSGTTPVTSNGQTIRQWKDKSGLGSNATQSGNAPVWNSSGYATFALASSQTLLLPNGTLPYSAGTNAYSIFTVIRPSRTDRNLTVVCSGNAGTNQFNGLQIQNGGVIQNLWYNNDTGGGALTSNTWALANINYDGRARTIFQTGSNVRTLSNASWAGTISNNIIGRESATNNWAYDGDIGEIVVYSAAMSTEQRQAVEGYLASKWSLTPLATIHPYKTLPVFTTPFAPGMIPGCALWIDSTDSICYTLSGSNVSQIRDKMGLLTYPAGGTSATLSTTSVPGFVFPSNASYTSSTTVDVSAFLTNRTDFTLAILASHTTSDALVNGIPISFGIDGNRLSPFFSYSSAGLALSFIDAATQGSPRLSVGGIIPTGTPSMVIYRRSGSNVSIRVNGSNSASSNFVSPPQFVDCNYTSYIAPGGAAWWGTMHEITHFRTAVSDLDVNRLEGYFASKWRLRGSLPSTHPRKTLPMFSPPFLPSTFSNVSIWIDAASSNAMTISGDTITLLNERSSNAVFEPLRGTVGPSYSLSTRGMTFLGSNQMFYYPYTLMTNTSSYGFSFVARFGTLDRQDLWALQYDYVETSCIFGFGRDRLGGGDLSAGAFYWHPKYNSINATSGVVVTQSNLPYLVTGYSSNGSNFIFRINGSVTTTTTNDFTIGNPGGSTDNVFGNLISVSFRDQVPGTNNNWTLHEFLYYKSGVALNQVQMYEGYLATKWGLQRYLPTTHPYKTVGL